jgi:hypothetical protein
MKYFLFFLVVISFLSCEALKKVASPKEFSIYGFDFRKYADSSFLFTPLTQLTRPYDLRGMIRIVGYPEVRKIQTSVTFGEGDNKSSGYKYIPQKLDPQEVIEEAYRISRSFGADALISFDIKSSKVVRGNVEVEKIELSGYAIKLR